ncbi:C45 family autoproteolytic acyltransferase/hydolase [Aquimarina algicola]|uniref:Linear amide C-N hydrolase n=1 Tax=Aquimarina algicola TaxID=2589995 RepID=A0A504JKG5_9FLAO|nr:C45 family peptidase [Aquimarina algicola]TPN89302.1 linear amide C-N hydrolase [Aquimarina algicola]
MYHPRLYGDFYEMGLKYGSLLHKNGFILPNISKEKKDFGLKSYEELKKFYPEVIEEINGFAKGIHEKPEQLGAFLLSVIPDVRGYCSVFAFKNKNSTIIGRNYDFLFSLKKFTESSLIAPKGKYAYISQSDVFIGRVDGVNEKGIFIAMSFVNGTQIRPGINFYFIVRKVLEECATIDGAIMMIKSAKVSSANNFLIADRFGNMAVVESAVEKSMVRYPKPNENFIHITNQFETKEMKSYDQGKVEWSKSTERYSRLKEVLMTTKHMDIQDAKKILSDSCVCLDLKKQKFGTIWSVVADIKALTIERAETKPKISNYKVEKRLDWWLNKQRK